MDAQTEKLSGQSSWRSPRRILSNLDCNLRCIARSFFSWSIRSWKGIILRFCVFCPAGDFAWSLVAFDEDFLGDEDFLDLLAFWTSRFCFWTALFGFFWTALLGLAGCGIFFDLPLLLLLPDLLLFDLDFDFLEDCLDVDFFEEEDDFLLLLPVPLPLFLLFLAALVS